MDPTQDAHREMAKQANGRVWELLDRPVRSRDEQAEIVEAAYASLYHWRLAGTEVHRQRGLWLLSRVHTVLGDGGQAVEFAQACLEWTNAHEHLMQDFDMAYAHEGMARALALVDRHEAARSHLQAARDAGARIADPEDRSIFTADLEAGEWHGLE